MARLVGDLRAEEDAHVLVGDRAHDRPELGGHALLADEERAQPVHARHALLGVDALVPVDAVLGEVEVLHRPLLALPQLVELAVGQEVRLAAVGRLLQGGIARRAEVDALGPGRGVLGHGREPSARLAGRPTWNRSATLAAWTSPRCAASACSCDRSSRTTSTASIAILAEPAVARWWGPQAEQPDREELLGPEPRFAIVVDGALAGWLGCEENTDPMYRSVGLDIFLTTARARAGPRARGAAAGHRPLPRARPPSASPSTRRPTTSARSAPTRPSASSPRAPARSTLTALDDGPARRPPPQSRADAAPARGARSASIASRGLRRSQDPIENIASRSWREKTSKATIVWVRLDAGRA